MPQSRSDYDAALAGVMELLDTARRASARVVNSAMTATQKALVSGKHGPHKAVRFPVDGGQDETQFGRLRTDRVPSSGRAKNEFRGIRQSWA